MKHCIAGLAAHVDAGKTTLSEALLFSAGATRRQGRVDHGDAFLDTDAMEKERGITIFSKQALLTWRKADIALMDTPGHTDFAGETERVLDVLDLAVLVISGPEGVQSHTRTLWNLLERHRTPTVLFVNKMDRCQRNPAEILRELSAQLSGQIVNYTEKDPEKIALCDEAALDFFLREGSIPADREQLLIRERRIFPCFFGSALRNEGVGELLDFLAWYDPGKAYPESFSARVYKIARDPQGARLTFLKVTGGCLKVRDLLSAAGDGGEPLWAEKAAELRLYSGAKYTSVPQAEAGQLCCVVGLSKTRPGDGLGAQTPGSLPLLQPCYACRLLLPPGTDLHYALDCLRALEEEEPLMQVEYIERKREIRIHSMGDVYLEVLRRRLLDRYGLEASFGESGVLYRETIAAPVEGVGHYEPLKHYAEVHLLLSPLPRGSGLVFDSRLHVDDLSLNWQRLIMTHLREKVHVGVLTGSPITDMRVTLVNGKAHLKHTEGGDFRQATYRALRQGLMKAESVLLEPWLSLELVLPEENLGRAMSDLGLMGASFDAPEDAPDGLRRLTALAPAARCASYGREVQIYTRGRGRMTAAFHSYMPCGSQEEIVRAIGYDPEADTWNSPDSVFCSHGAGYTVKWNEVEAHMHLPLLKEQREEAAVPVRAAVSSAPYRGTAAEDAQLQAIFERTYGSAKTRQLLSSPPRSQPAEKTDPEAAPAAEVLLVDGYNLLFAMPETKETARDSIETAREQLIRLLCSYAGVTGTPLILVFDAYRVPGGAGSVEKRANIFVIYTPERQTADSFIEKTTFAAKGTPRIRVVTSDAPEQMIALGNKALRTSAKEFRQELIRAQGSIEAFLARLNKPGGEKVVEKAFKEAWRKKQESEGG